MEIKPTPLSTMTPLLIGPCGINCVTCMNFQRSHSKKNFCEGCHSDGTKVNHCSKCKIRNCAMEKGFNTCAECKDMPCKLIKNIDKRYRNSYNISLIENLKRVDEVGAEQFIEEEKVKWKCKYCGGIRCVHRDQCCQCGQKEE